MAITFPASRLSLIYLISDNTLTDENFVERSRYFLELVRAAVEAKVSLVQIREKQLSAINIFSLTNSAAQITKNAETLLLVNDRADIAFSAGADGVHLTAGSLSAKTVRENFPEKFIIGISAHSLPEVRSAAENKANFATFSPIFATPSKVEFGEPQGIEKLKEACQAVNNFPVIALGGIDETNFQAVFAAGAAGIAGIRFLNDSNRLPQIIKQIRNE